jgi:hypothetical protein
VGSYLKPAEQTSRTDNLLPEIHFDTILSPKGKGKAIQLKALTGPEGSRRLTLSDFKKIGT